MRYLLVSTLCFAMNFLQAQSVDITQETAGNIWYGDIQFDSKGNLFVNKHQYDKGELMYFSDGKWYTAKAIEGSLVNYQLIGDNIYIITDNSKQPHYRLSRWRNSSWDSISVSSLQSSVSAVMMTAQKELVVRGIFTDENGPFYLAKLVDSTWEPIRMAEEEINRILRWHTMFSPVADAKGVLYFYTWATYPLSYYSRKVISWDGTIMRKLGTDSTVKLSSLAVTPSGKVYGGLTEKKPSGIWRWNDNTWQFIPCSAGFYDGNWLPAVTPGDGDDVFAAGYAKKGSEYLVMKYSHDKWEEYATIPYGPVNHLYYCKGNVYAITDNSRRIFMIPADTKKPVPGPQVTKPVPVDTYHTEVWNIYKDYMAEHTSVWFRLDINIKGFNATEDESDSKGHAKNGKDAVQEFAGKINAYKKRISDLRIGDGKNLLASVLTDYFNESLRYAGHWNTIFSCYIKDDDTCFEAEKKLLSKVTADLNRKQKELEKAADLYKNRNGLD